MTELASRYVVWFVVLVQLYFLIRTIQVYRSMPKKYDDRPLDMLVAADIEDTIAAAVYLAGGDLNKARDRLVNWHRINCGADEEWHEYDASISYASIAIVSAIIREIRNVERTNSMGKNAPTVQPKQIRNST